MAHLTLQWQFNNTPQTRNVDDAQPISIGRRSDCDVVVSAPTISRQHAQIYAESGVFYLRNLSQTNHVHVNDQVALPPGKRLPLNNGDTFRVGPVHFAIASVVIDQTAGPQIRCSTCNRNVAYQPEGFCPWCGTALSSGTTVYGKFV